MLRVRASTVFVLALLLSAGCHHIKSDYPKYLEKHPASPTLPHVVAPAHYSIAEATLRHHTVIRSGTAGYGNKWIVEYGEMLSQTLSSAEVRAAFASLSAHNPAGAGPGFQLAFELVDYQVSGFSAHIKLRIKILESGTLLLDKTYLSDGAPQAGKVVWGGAFSMRNALHTTTKDATDVILRQLLIDLERLISARGAAAA